MTFNTTPGYGHRGLSVVSGQPTRDFQRLLRDMNRVEDVPGSSSGGILDDSNNLLAAKLQSVSVPPEILQGTIYHVFSGLQTYLVITDGNKGQVVCGDCFGPLQVQSPNVGMLYTIGARVIILRYGDSGYGVILGSPSEPVLNCARNYSGLISGIGTFHYDNRKYIREVTNNTDTGRGLPDYARNRPADICEGDYSITNMSGGGFHTDAFQTALKQAHDCGVWAFGMDKLLRFIGRSIQELSFAHKLNHFALKAKIYWAASKAAWIELGKMKLADGA
jgi:hypothetical protein